MIAVLQFIFSYMKRKLTFLASSDVKRKKLDIIDFTTELKCRAQSNKELPS